MKCSVCGSTIKKDPVSGWDGGHNAHPVNDGRCCDDCNTHIVIPLRINLSLIHISEPTRPY